MTTTPFGEFWKMFMGHAPNWYKVAVVVCLAVLNPLTYIFAGPFAVGWLILIEFIATLALALKCFPFQPGGLLLIEAVLLGLVSPETINKEVMANVHIMFLVLFVVTAVHFLKDLLTLVFVKAILSIRSKVLLALFFAFATAILSAMLDALTVTAVVISVFMELYSIYHRYASSKGHGYTHDVRIDSEIHEDHHHDLMDFRAYMRGVMMHAAVGTMLGGIMTIIGEPQNLIIGHTLSWNFKEFFEIMLPVTLPVLCVGLILSMILEKLKWSDYGMEMPTHVRMLLVHEIEKISAKRTVREYNAIVVQSVGAVLLVVCLVAHIAEIYLIGLTLLALLTCFLGATDEHHIGNACKESVPFVAVLAIFFGIVGMIHTQHLFAPIMEWVLTLDGKSRLIGYYASTGILSMISDNVFVATLFITEAERLFTEGKIGREEFEMIAVAINTGTNVPSISTPNGQAAFLFLLMSPLAPLIRLSYGRMALLALPYAIVCTSVGALSIWFFL